jgi:hypothetical protein
MADELTGGCACGGVRYRLLARPLWTHCCHCTWCQRETGSAFAINALVEFDRVEVTAGRPEPLLTPSASGRGQVITRCPDCRVALWSAYGGPAILFVRAGTLDQRQRIVPDIHIFTASKLPWVRIPPGARSVPEFYSYRETWPDEAWKRREAAIMRYRAASL